jgi:hypothetical protein
LDWLSAAVEKICDALVGMVVFFSINLVITPPIVSIPSDNDVSAKDKNSGKEQSITIKASSGLSDEEVEKMIKDAEANGLLRLRRFVMHWLEWLYFFQST